jgi:uncharacterized membrane protein
MAEKSEEALIGRVDRLEREVEELRRELRLALRASDGGGLSEVDRVDVSEFRSRETREKQAVPAGSSSARGGGEPGEAWDFSGVTATASGAGRRFRLPFEPGELRGFRSGEWWLNKVGIGLLLLGVAFLFVYSVERGWIGPWARVAVGAAIGASLIAVGLRVYQDRRAFSQVLLGGGIGALYITVFAAFQMYSLLPYPVAFSLMVAVTLLAVGFSLHQDGVALSLIGVLGGLGTPFLLHTDAGTLGGLVIYTCLILVGMGAVYFRKEWVSLLAVSFVGGWMVFLVGYAEGYLFATEMPLDDRIIFQTGVAFAWLLFWLLPMAREILRERDAARPSTHLFIVSTPLVSFGFTALVWDLAATDLGWISLSAAALYALAALALRSVRGNSNDLSYTHVSVALLFLTLTAVLMLRGDALLFTLAAEAAILHYLARRFSDRAISAEAHLLFFVAAAWLAFRLVFGTSDELLGVAEPAIFNARALVDLAVIGLMFGVSPMVLPRNLGTVYRVAAHAAVLGWLWRELSVLPGGEAYVTIAWGLYAVGLLVAGLRLDRSSAVRGGMATLFLVVAKLFLVDLAEVEAFWRVLLFLGFGVLFLSLSYYLRALWRPGGRSAEETGRSGDSI